MVNATVERSFLVVTNAIATVNDRWPAVILSAAFLGLTSPQILCFLILNAFLTLSLSFKKQIEFKNSIQDEFFLPLMEVVQCLGKFLDVMNLTFDQVQSLFKLLPGVPREIWKSIVVNAVPFCYRLKLGIVTKFYLYYVNLLTTISH